MELNSITVFKKSNSELITRVFEDEEGIKQITSDEYEVIIKNNDSQECESKDNGLGCYSYGKGK